MLPVTEHPKSNGTLKSNSLGLFTQFIIDLEGEFMIQLNYERRTFVRIVMVTSHWADSSQLN